MTFNDMPVDSCGRTKIQGTQTFLCVMNEFANFPGNFLSQSCVAACCSPHHSVSPAHTKAEYAVNRTLSDFTKTQVSILGRVYSSGTVATHMEKLIPCEGKEKTNHINSNSSQTMPYSRTNRDNIQELSWMMLDNLGTDLILFAIP